MLIVAYFNDILMLHFKVKHSLYAKLNPSTAWQVSFNPNEGGGGIILPTWFSLSNSETVNAVTFAFCSIQ